ncbi:EamA family transporter RarD [Falsarthrobacter nasiphocae]|uniref:Chloramphenicol-sensitive protein RarD n=1 Tax=Falsarthrobacter nasiphocae TaxID=189863 RepID=A0AAE3YIB0_9MICC|nr:EamA family transporter RarD [Falsarthrobacter nasiphocae]MDR6892453.1 chloramphenicol-sensitive protein RarD [Falsarthrobacter nasiphocae]
MAENTRAGASGTGRGVLYGLGAYLLWGVLPLYFALLAPAAGVEVVAARVLFSAVFCALLLTVMRSWGDVRWIVADRSSVARLALASVLIAANWLIFVLAVLSHNALEAALGYFINPMIPVLLGVVVLKERLRRMQWAAMGLGALAVVVLTAALGRVPFIALSLALTFGLYGFTKKGLRPGTTALGSLTVETLILTIPALVALGLPMAGIATGVLGEPTLLRFGAAHFWIMAASGIVTAVPLLFFGAAASRLPLSLIGMLQYVTPVMQFLCALLVFREEMSTARWIGFGLIWLALAVLTSDAVQHSVRARGAVRRAAAAS